MLVPMMVRYKGCICTEKKPTRVRNAVKTEDCSVAFTLLLLPKFFSLKISLFDALLVLQLPCAEYSAFLVIAVSRAFRTPCEGVSHLMYASVALNHRSEWKIIAERLMIAVT